MEVDQNKHDQSEIVIYESSDGVVRLDVQLDGETVWLTQSQMAELFGRDVSVIRKHVKNVYEEGELDEQATKAKIALVQYEGERRVTREVDAFNLDVIISVGYRVKSQQGVRFRQWATAVLKDYLVKGFAMDDERLKNFGGGFYWRELLDRAYVYGGLCKAA